MAVEAQYLRSADMYEFTTVAAVESGQIVELPDGRVGVVAPLAGAAAATKTTAHTKGVFKCAKVASVTLLRGQEAYFVPSSNALSFYAPGRVYAGIVVEDAAASASYVNVALNERKDYAIDTHKSAWTTTAVNGLGTTRLPGDQYQLAFDAVAEAAKAVLLSQNTVDVDDKPIMEARIAVYDIGDAAALDIDVGLASGDHATDFETVAAFATVHFDGTALDIKVQSDDGTTDVAAADSTINAVDDTYFHVLIDARDKTDVQVYVNGVDAVPAGTTLTLSAYTSTLSAIAHMEKTSDDTTAELRVDYMRVWTGRE